MAVDLTKLNEDELLSALGDGEWVIAMPEGYVDLHVTTKWRDELAAWTGTRFVRWVLNGVRYEIIHDSQSSGDRSGEAHRRPADPLMLRTDYSTLTAWLKNEHTGQWEATYESGYGKHWETYSNVLDTYIRECLSELFQTQYAIQFAQPDDDCGDAVWNDVSLVEIDLVQALMMVIGRITPADAWTRYEAVTRQQIAEEEHLSAERTALYMQKRAQAQQFWQVYFDDLHQVRIEQPQFEELHLEKRLYELFLDIGPDIIEAIAEVGIPGDFSNKVSARIRALATSALVE